MKYYRKKISHFGTFLEISLQEFTIGDCMPESIAEMLSETVDGAISPLKALGRHSHPVLVSARRSPIPFGLQLPTLRPTLCCTKCQNLLCRPIDVASPFFGSGTNRMVEISKGCLNL